MRMVTLLGYAAIWRLLEGTPPPIPPALPPPKHGAIPREAETRCAKTSTAALGDAGRLCQTHTLVEYLTISKLGV